MYKRQVLFGVCVCVCARECCLCELILLYNYVFLIFVYILPNLVFVKCFELLNNWHLRNDCYYYYLLSELEAEASIPQERRLKLSEPDVAFCISMIEKYGDNYKVR